jgi:two-component system, cell cycle response regulator
MEGWEVDRLKLLIIEDDPNQLELMRQTLEQHFGAGTVHGVGSRAEAMKLDMGRFDLILCNYHLPDGSGMTLLEQIVQHTQTPVLMVTGQNVGTIAAEAVRKGATDYIVKFGEYLFTLPLVVEKNLTLAKIKRENESLRQELERALQTVRDKNAQLQQSLQRMEEMAATDPLTRLYNRRHFGHLLDQLFDAANRYSNDLTCVMIDLDNFKNLNDSRGHQMGDQLLVLAGRVIQASMRRMDVAARYGGDEFVLLLPHAGADDAAGVMQRIRDEYRSASATTLGSATGVSMSAGMASLLQHRPAHADELVALADAALYKAKDAGRDRTAISSPQLQQA